MAFIAPILWAFVVLLDIYFTQKAYSEATEGTIISGLYQGIVLLAIPFVGYSWPSSGWMFFASGMLFLFSCHWYLRSLVIGGDGPIAQIIFNLCIILVPLFAWIFLGEHLRGMQYMGIALAFLGGFVLSWDEKIVERHLGRIVKNMFPAVIALSLSMTLQKEGFAGTSDFTSGFLTFSFGVIFAALIAFFIHPKRKDMVYRLINLTRRYWHSFVLGETLSVIAIFSSSYAISLSPSISFIIVIESLVPIFVMIFSVVLARLFLFLKRSEYRILFDDQVTGITGKIIATLIIALAIYFVI